jgi:hypothetical protein
MPADSLLAARLEAARQELLDLGLRNPLLNFRPSKVRGVAVVGEDAAAVYELLVRRLRVLQFAPLPEAPAAPRLGWKGDPARAARRAEALGLPLPEPVPAPAPLPPVVDPLDSRLQTAETADQLESRLLNTYYTARTSLEETGANILYLALGCLTWYETPTSPEPRQAPLLLLPVVLERGTVAERFRLLYYGAEPEGNLSLQARLKADFGVHLPLPDLDEQPWPDYVAAVQTAVAGLPRWAVAPDSITLGFFSFSKLMLYRDLDPAAWPAESPLLQHAALQALLGPETGFQDQPPTFSETDFLDDARPAAELHQVLDADSSQLLALLAVHEGRNLVIQGPPGTGKSQTIANLLAEAIGAGKKVLFVAEKMAALEVVKRRLDALGLGVACLELHSHKTNKKAVLEELKGTLQLGRPAAAPALEDQLANLPRYRATLNEYAQAVNSPIAGSRRTAQQVAGELLLLQEQTEGVELPRVPFPDMASWTDADAAHAEILAARLQATLRKTGVPQRLPFWGSELTVLLPAEHHALAALLPTAHAAVTSLQAAAQQLARHLGLPAPADRAAAEQLLPAARHALLAPPLAGYAVADAAWTQQLAHLTEVFQAGTRYQALRQQYAAHLLPEAWEQDLQAERAAVLTYGEKWWRFLSGDYRQARRRLQQLWRGPLPKATTDVLAGVDAVQDAARYAQVVAAAAPLGQQLFGAAWQGLGSGWPLLMQAQEYLTRTHQRIGRGELPPELLAYLAGAGSGAVGTGLEVRLPELVAALEDALTRHRTGVQAVAEALQLNEARRFGPEGRLQFQTFGQQQATLAAWAAELPALRLTTEWNNVAATVQTDNLPELLLLAERWEPAVQHLAAAVRQTWLEFLQRHAYARHPALRQFEQASHEETAARFRLADEAALHLNRVRALRQHHAHLPNLQAAGQMMMLRHEFAKKTRHLPLRRLMQQAGQAVQAIKPVFMMSPLSVASYLPPGALAFDLVVFDEASQVKPVEALGAIARGRQLVVVGDSRQLPPTSFFDSLTGDDSDTPDGSVTADIPSILELCRARQMPELMLRWHYRSQHESLIEPSNQLFYDNKLVVFPSPGGPGDLGLVYHHLPHTHYERGTTRTNPLEAQAVAAAVLHHARTAPGRTLGVVAFSMAQRQAIELAVEASRRQHPETEPFFSQHPHEPFFIKNLENVQGDERDVVFISLGYGRTAAGQLTMNFGPLNGEGGERRLNVLISRARQRCEVFTNLTADDLDLDRTPAKGVAALKAFLTFAQHGPAGRPPLPATDAPFETVVARALMARGYAVQPQVGSQGFYLDLAVSDPAQPGRYLLGIIGDGTMYHHARSARDRNRLRPQVLEAMGWHLHHIWSTDWLRDPASATERVVQAIEAAHRPAPAAEDAADTTIADLVSVVREEPAAAPAAVAVPYQVAQLPAAVAHRALHQHGLSQLALWLTQVVRIESPVHIEEATRRLAQASGATQVGARIRKAGEAAALLAANLRHLRRHGDFLWENTMQQPPLRDRSQLPTNSRRLALVAPEELILALRTVVTQSFGLPREAVFLPAVRLLGFARLSDEMRQQLEPLLAGLLERGELVEVNGVVKPAV